LQFKPNSRGKMGQTSNQTDTNLLTLIESILIVSNRQCLMHDPREGLIPQMTIFRICDYALEIGS